MKAAEAKRANAEQDRKRAIAKVSEERGRLDGYKERAARAQVRFDKTIALAVSAKPRAVDWYAHPGPLDAEPVRIAAGLSSVQLHRLMERFAKHGGRS